MKKSLLAVGLISILVLSACSGTSQSVESPEYYRAQEWQRLHMTQEKQAVKPEAYNVLEDNGFTEINLTGAPLLSCSKDDSIFNSYGFIAKNPFNKTVKGTVCCGWFKACTIRYSH